MTTKAGQKNRKGADEVQNPHAIFPKPLPAVLHGLYIDLVGFQLDRRTRVAQLVKKLTFSLLEDFPSPAPAAAQLIAQRTAFKLIRAASFEVFILNEGKAIARAESDYVGLTESIRKDIQALWVMSKEGGRKDPVPDLQEYLRKKAEEATPVIPVKPEQPEPGPATPDNSKEKSIGKKTLF